MINVYDPNEWVFNFNTLNVSQFMELIANGSTVDMATINLLCLIVKVWPYSSDPTCPQSYLNMPISDYRTVVVRLNKACQQLLESLKNAF